VKFAVEEFVEAIFDLMLGTFVQMMVKAAGIQPVQLLTAPCEVAVVLRLNPSQVMALCSLYQAQDHRDPNTISSSFHPMQHSQPCGFHRHSQPGTRH
jgi:hypothetical protein